MGGPLRQLKQPLNRTKGTQGNMRIIANPAKLSKSSSRRIHILPNWQATNSVLHRRQFAFQAACNRRNSRAGWSDCSGITECFAEVVPITPPGTVSSFELEAPFRSAAPRIGGSFLRKRLFTRSTAERSTTARGREIGGWTLRNPLDQRLHRHRTFLWLGVPVRHGTPGGILGSL